MNKDDLTVIIAAHDREIENLRALVEAQGLAIRILREGLLDVVSASELPHNMIGKVERLCTLVDRHDRTLRAMHRGLHDTSDPGLNDRTRDSSTVIEKRTEK